MANMEWMYDGAKSEVNKEEYLLGKPLDKGFEGTLGQINAVEYDCTPASIFASSAEHQVDIERKIVEDPLVALKKKELETRKKLLDNPVKMKEINKYIEKMRKKKKKNRRNESDDEEDINKKLLKKLGGMKSGESPESSRSPTPERRRKYKDSSDNDDSDSLYKKSSYSSKDNHPPNRRRSHSPRERTKGKYRARNYSYQRRSSSRDRQRKISRSKDSYRRRERRRSSSKEKSRKKPKKTRVKISFPLNENITNKTLLNHLKIRRKVVHRTQAKSEREKKLKEMMENANWRDEKRKENVKRSIEENKKSTKEYEEYYDPDFIRKQLSKAAESGTVEKRLNANKHHIQKGSDIMNTNFARR
nr:LOW QUALITY PROTEIN: pre-mRNA-splicing factor CWC25 homolog [Lepeophtheirus salmonis]